MCASSLALVVWHTKQIFIRSITLSCAACLALPNFSTLSHKWHNFQRGGLLNIKCMFWFSLQLLLEAFIILWRIHWDIINVSTSSCKVPVIPVRFLIKLEFSKHIFEKSSNIIFHENMSSGSLSVPYWQTDKMKLTVAFCNFANMPKERWLSLCLTFLEQVWKIIHSENIQNECIWQLYKIKKI